MAPFFKTKLPGQKPAVQGMRRMGATIATEEIKNWQNIQTYVVKKIKEIQEIKKVQKPENFSTIILKLQQMTTTDEFIYTIKNLIQADLSSKDVNQQIENLKEVNELIDGEIAKIKKQNRI